MFRLSFALIGQFFSSVHSQPAFRTISESQAGFGTTFKGPGGYLKPGTSSLKRVTGRISQLVSDFIEASRNFILDFLHKKTTENCENHKWSFNKYSVSDFSIVKKKYSFRDTIPLNLVFYFRHEPSAADLARAG